MTLEHDSGDMDGLVLEGEYQGRLLSALELTELLSLLARCHAEDARSAALLEAYLDRTRGDEWRDAAPGPGSRAAQAGGAMNREEALAVLGLEPGADDQAIREAHRRLMQRLHPDRGGSDYLAAKINEAKRLLLGD
jgi:DnaJ-domain-containing protein 1